MTLARPRRAGWSGVSWPPGWSFPHTEFGAQRTNTFDRYAIAPLDDARSREPQLLFRVAELPQSI